MAVFYKGEKDSHETWTENGGRDNSMTDYSFHSFGVTGEKLSAMGKWKYLALHNELTDLPNRRMLDMSMESYMVRAYQQQSTLAVVLINIDRFKEINDMFGYSAGDAFLIELSNRFTSLSEHYIQAFHLSGASFALLIEQADDLQEKIKRVTAIFDMPFHVGENSILIDANIGISLYPDQSIDVEELLYYAGKAMAQAKASAENRYFIFQPEMDE